MNPTKSTEQLLNESTLVAQKAANMIGQNFTQGVGVTPITSSSLSNNEPQIQLPQTQPPSTTSSAINAAAFSNAEQLKVNIDAKEKAYLEQAKETATSSKSQLSKLFGLQQKASEDKISGYNSDEFKAKKELATKTYNDVLASRKAQDAEIEAVNNSAQFPDQKAQTINQINNKYAFKNAQLSLTSSIASNEYQSAKQAIDDLYTLTMEMYEPQINYYSQLAQNDNKAFTDAEVRILENKRDEYKTAQTQATENIKANGDAMIKYNSLGAGITINDTAEQRVQKIASVGGEFSGDVLDRQIKQAQLAKLNIDLARANQSNIVANAITPYEKEKQTRVINSVDDLMGRANLQTVGFASLARFAPASLPRNFATDLNTLKANIAFGELTAMRSASKTGGALGQVSERELALLESSLAGLDQGQSPSSFRKNLQQIKDSLDRWYGAVDNLSEEQQLKAMGYTNEQIQQIKNSQ